VPLCYLDGDFLPLAEARIPVLDRGFIFGEGIYEVVPVFGGCPLRFEQHLARLARSLAAIGMQPPLAVSEWSAVARRLIAANGGGDQTLYLQITRGAAPRHHLPAAGLAPTVFAMSNPLVPADLREPVRAVLREDCRWTRCDIKATSLLANVLLRQEAAAAGAHEAILVRDGRVTEGASSNVFVVIEGRIRTPPLSRFILPGVTRDLLLELLADGADAVLEHDVSRDELLASEEVWLTSSGRELAPVGHLDGRRVGAACPGPVYARVLDRYLAYRRGNAGSVP
jgi:D-alanine transaminase